LHIPERASLQVYFLLVKYRGIKYHRVNDTGRKQHRANGQAYFIGLIIINKGEHEREQKHTSYQKSSVLGFIVSRPIERIGHEDVEEAAFPTIHKLPQNHSRTEKDYQPKS